MISLVLVLSALLATGLFGTVCAFETRRGVRFFESSRSELDRFVERMTFIAEHVDFAAFLRDEVKRIAQKLVHDVIHLSLQAIRSIERVLTRVMKHLRSKDPMQSVSRESSRPFIETLSNFKEHLEATRPAMPPVTE